MVKKHFNKLSERARNKIVENGPQLIGILFLILFALGSIYIWWKWTPWAELRDLFSANVIKWIFQFVLFGGLLFYSPIYSWWAIRITSLIGIVYSQGLLVYGLLVWRGRERIDGGIFNEKLEPVLLLLVSSVIVFLSGEMLFHLRKISNSKSRMICPSCMGKGFVDLKDLERMGKARDQSGQGYCRFCDGQGDVPRGITKIKDPL